MKFTEPIFFSEKINLIKAGILQENMANRLFDYWKKSISEYNDEDSSPHIDFCILLASIRANLLYLQVYDAKAEQIVHEFGLKVVLPFPAEHLSKIKNFPEMIEFQGQKIGTWHRKCSRPSFCYSIFAFFPHNYNITTKIIQLKNLLIYYHSVFQRQRVVNVKNLFETMNHKIVRCLNQLLQTSTTVHAIYLQIESLTAYVDLGRSILVQNIQNSITKTLQQKEYFTYAVNPCEYLLLIANEETDALEFFFKKAKFYYKTLILNHKAKIFSMSKEITCSSELWSHFEKT